MTKIPIHFIAGWLITSPLLSFAALTLPKSTPSVEEMSTTVSQTWTVRDVIQALEKAKEIKLSEAQDAQHEAQLIQLQINTLQGVNDQSTSYTIPQVSGYESKSR